MVGVSLFLIAYYIYMTAIEVDILEMETLELVSGSLYELYG